MTSVPFWILCGFYTAIKSNKVATYETKGYNSNCDDNYYKLLLFISIFIFRILFYIIENSRSNKFT